MKIEWLPIRRVIPPHEMRSERKLRAIFASMRREGWRGDPLVVVPYGDNYQALNGSHRLEAAWRLYQELKEEDEVDEDEFPARVPAIVLDEERFYKLTEQEVGSDNPLDILIFPPIVVAKLLYRIGEVDAAAVMRRERN